MTSPSHACACGQATLAPDARFCHVCGRAVGPARCAACSSDLNPGAKFCHRCGTPVDAAAAALLPGRPTMASVSPTQASASMPATSTTPWIIAAVLIVALLGGIIYKVSKDSSTPDAPVMANAGNAGNGSADGGATPSGGAPFAGGGGAAGAAPFAGGGGVPNGRAPDISQMSPRERFNRLYDRIMRAASQGDSATVINFTPMAIGAYTQLDSNDVDSRFDVAMLYAGVGQYPAAAALADSILKQAPGHLYGYVIQAEIATDKKDVSGRKKAIDEFSKHYDAEIKKARPEYAARRGILDQFRQSANLK